MDVSAMLGQDPSLRNIASRNHTDSSRQKSVALRNAAHLPSMAELLRPPKILHNSSEWSFENPYNLARRNIQNPPTEDSAKGKAPSKIHLNEVQVNNRYKAPCILDKQKIKLISKNPSPAIPAYSLRIRQQPITARACGFGGRYRRAIEPPPILQMEVEKSGASAEQLAAFLRIPYAVVHCCLWNPNTDTDDTTIPNATDKRQKRRLMGTLVASPFVGKDEFGMEGCFFAFSDLSVGMPGTYQLRFQLVILDPTRMGHELRNPVQSIAKSKIFEVFNAKDFGGPMATTALTKTLKRQGCLIFVKRGEKRKEDQEKSATRDDSEESPDEEALYENLCVTPPSKITRKDLEALIEAHPESSIYEKGFETAMSDIQPPHLLDIIDDLRQAASFMKLKIPPSKPSPNLNPAQMALVDNIFREFWAIFNGEWDLNIQNYSGSSHQSSAGPPTENSIQLNTSRDPTQRRDIRNNDENSDNPNENEKGSNRPMKVLHSPDHKEETAKFACPYRKKNPQKYNPSVRHWRSCALTPLSDVSRVKGHLYRHHRIYQCERCSEVFESQKSLKSHFLAVTPCGLKPYTQADGVTCGLEKKLRSKKKTTQNQSQEDRWKELYLVLFPNTSTVPSPYFETTQDSVASDIPDSTELASYEEFSRLELPRVFKAALETIIEMDPEPIEEQLRDRLVNIIRECQELVFSSYRSRAAINEDTDERDMVTVPSVADAAFPPTVSLNTSSLPRREFRVARQRREKLHSISSPAAYQNVHRAEPYMIYERPEAGPAMEQSKQHQFVLLPHASDFINTPEAEYSFDASPQISHQPSSDIPYAPLCYQAFENTLTAPMTNFATTAQESFSFPSQSHITTFPYQDGGGFYWGPTFS